MQPISLRRGGPDDSARAWAIYREAVLDGAGAHYTAAQRRAWVPEAAEPAWMAARLAAGRAWFAGRDGRDEGFLVATGVDAAGPVHLDLFFVAPQARGRGIATALLDAFDAAAEGQGCSTHASLYLHPILAARGWRTVRPDRVDRGGEVLLRYLMERPASRS